jgi:hypothetical protein
MDFKNLKYFFIFFFVFYFLLFDFSVKSLSYLLLFTINLKIFTQNFEIFFFIFFIFFIYFPKP